MKSCKPDVLSLTAVTKCGYWNIYFHIEYLSICVLHYWCAYTVLGLKFDNFGQQYVLGDIPSFCMSTCCDAKSIKGSSDKIALFLLSIHILPV